MPGFQQRFIQRFRQGFQHHSFSKGSSSLIARHHKRKTPRKSRSCPHIGSNNSKVATRLQQSSSQTSNLTTRHIKKSKNVNRKTKSTPALVPSKMFQPEVPARFQQGFTMFQHQDPEKFQQSSNDFPARFQLAGLQQGSSRVLARLQQGCGKI